jgi:hypothetical protein
MGKIRRTRSPRRCYPSRLQGAARAEALTDLTGGSWMYRCSEVSGLSDNERRAFHLSVTLKHGRGQRTANTSPTREIGLACRPHTTTTASPTGLKPTIAVLIAVTDSSSSFSPTCSLCRLTSPRPPGTYSCHFPASVPSLAGVGDTVSEKKAMLLFCLHSIGRCDEAALLFYTMYHVFWGL